MGRIRGGELCHQERKRDWDYRLLQQQIHQKEKTTMFKDRNTMTDRTD